MTTYEILKSAVLNKNAVALTYGRHVREVCPHVLGWRDGDEWCLAYQFGGGSSQPLKRDGDPANWKCLEVAKISGAKIMPNEKWHTTDREPETETSCVDRVDVMQPAGRS